MKIDRVKLTIQFESQLDKKWVGLEAEIDNSESPEMALTKLKDIINKWAASSSQGILDGSPLYSPAGWLPSVNQPLREIQVKEEEREIGTKPEDILSSPDLVVLESYRLIMKGNPELERAYILRHDQLCAQHLDQLSKKQ